MYYCASTITNKQGNYAITQASSLNNSSTDKQSKRWANPWTRLARYIKQKATGHSNSTTHYIAPGICRGTPTYHNHKTRVMYFTDFDTASCTHKWNSVSTYFMCTNIHNVKEQQKCLPRPDVLCFAWCSQNFNYSLNSSYNSSSFWHRRGHTLIGGMFSCHIQHISAIFKNLLTRTHTGQSFTFLVELQMHLLPTQKPLTTTG